MIEVWKDIKEFEGKYQISNLGRAKSLQRRCLTKGNKYRLVKEMILKTPKNSKGYRYVALSNKGKIAYRRVHVLVAEAFIYKPNNSIKNMVNHIDGNKENNCVNNLEWVTAKENTQDALKSGLFRNEIVVALTDNNEIKYIFHSAREAMRTLGTDSSSIAKSIKENSEHQHVGGYKWTTGRKLCGRRLNDE